MKVEGTTDKNTVSYGIGHAIGGIEAIRRMASLRTSGTGWSEVYLDMADMGSKLAVCKTCLADAYAGRPSLEQLMLHFFLSGWFSGWTAATDAIFSKVYENGRDLPTFGGVTESSDVKVTGQACATLTFLRTGG